MAYEIDSKDRLILDILEKKGDATTRYIAKQTFLPITTIHNRIKKLKAEKIIRNFSINIDQKKVDKGLLVYILISVNLRELKSLKKTQYDLAKSFQKFPFTEKIDVVSGGTDLVLTIRVRDVDEFDKVLLGKIQMVKGVENTQSLIVIHGK